MTEEHGEETTLLYTSGNVEEVNRRRDIGLNTIIITAASIAIDDKAKIKGESKYVGSFH